MDEQSKATLEAILATDVNALTDEDRAFLRARRSYIPLHLQETYASVLDEAPQTVEALTEPIEPSEQEEAPKKTKKSKV